MRFRIKKKRTTSEDKVFVVIILFFVERTKYNNQKQVYDDCFSTLGNKFLAGGDWNAEHHHWVPRFYPDGGEYACGATLLESINKNGITGLWSFFSLIITASYTAGPTIVSAEDLPTQSNIRYGMMKEPWVTLSKLMKPDLRAEGNITEAGLLKAYHPEESDENDVQIEINGNHCRRIDGPWVFGLRLTDEVRYFYLERKDRVTLVPTIQREVLRKNEDDRYLGFLENIRDVYV
ncbi:hypothetical protein FQA39_LY12707 [Lamprigera yunnana]|nr:hypothetical protein FQA39_LY12707 [Lamprigera yunnana]